MEFFATMLLDFMVALFWMMVVSYLTFLPELGLITLLGRFVGDGLIPTGRDIKNMVMECIADDQVDLFLDFLLKMLCWLPERRATAEELRKHPWLIKSET